VLAGATLGHMIAHSHPNTQTGEWTPAGRPATGDRAGSRPLRESVLELAPLDSATPCARLHAGHVLREWGLAELADDAALIVSELVTNAADASATCPDQPPVTLRLLATADSLVIEVWDRNGLPLAPRVAHDDDECGRGLTVVAALATHWGCELARPPHKVVWAALAWEPLIR